MRANGLCLARERTTASRRHFIRPMKFGREGRWKLMSRVHASVPPCRKPHRASDHIVAKLRWLVRAPRRGQPWTGVMTRMLETRSAK